MRFALVLLIALGAMVPAVRAEDGRGLYVVAINGGGDKQDNFASHLGHLQQLMHVLGASGIPRDHITVLASDGSAAAPDLATREPEAENAWLLQGTQLDPILRDLTTFENSQLPGVDLRPATVASLTKTIGELRGRLRPGDTLLMYVTDHGSQSRRDPIENRITLWGESISVRKLGALLARLPPSVRVVSLMSQCFSGGFAYLHEARERRATPNGTTCGYFSSTPDRPAYGCYPELRGQKAVGHSFAFLSALAARGHFPAAHADILVSDETPDIPLRSSDVYLAEQLARAAGSPEREAAFADPFVGKAFASREFSGESRLLDRIASVYALARPSSLTEIDRQADGFFDVLDQLDADAKTWESALGDFNRANLDAFLDAKPTWRPRLDDRTMRALDTAGRRKLAAGLLAELGPFVLAEPARSAEANRLMDGLAVTDEINYRTEVRVAALLRMRFVLTSVAGRQWSKSDPRQSQAVDALLKCEDLTLPLTAPPRMAEPADVVKLPSFDEDKRAMATANPGWLGVVYVPVNRDRRKHLSISDGAVQITSVLPRSPAALAGLRTGDIVVAAGGRPLVHSRALRPLIAAATVNAALGIEVLRGASHMILAPVVGLAPRPKARN